MRDRIQVLCFAGLGVASNPAVKRTRLSARRSPLRWASKNMYRFIVALSITTLASCAIIGTKEVLTVEDSSAWKTIKTGHGAYHSYRCGEMPFVSFAMNEIVFKANHQSYGPVIPVIPSGKERNYEDTNLSIKIEIVGFTDVVNYKKEDLSIHVFMNNKELLLVDRNLSKITQKFDEKTHSQWVQYDITYAYSHKLQGIEKLNVKFDYPFSNCAIPELSLVRKKIQDNEFVIAPGV